jgi:hypothetical protein
VLGTREPDGRARSVREPAGTGSSAAARAAGTEMGKQKSGQRAAVPQPAQDPERLGLAAPLSAQAALELWRRAAPPGAGPLPLGRVARLRSALEGGYGRRMGPNTFEVLPARSLGAAPAGRDALDW